LVIVSGFVLVFSAMLLLGALRASHRGPATAISPLRFSLAVYPPRRLLESLQGLGAAGVGEIFGVVRFSTFATKSANRRHMASDIKR
jgi:hypothetical protein